MARVTNFDFLACAFFQVTADEQFWVTGFAGDPLEVPHCQWAGRGGPPGIPRCVRPGHNNYVAVSSFMRGSDGRYHRRKANFSRMFAVMVDDIGTKIPERNIKLEPSALVETSPANFQAWYFLNPPETDAQKAERLINGMIANGLTSDSSDPGMRGVTRYGRLPEGTNGKAKYVEKIGSPFVQRVKQWEPSKRYSIEIVADAYGVDLTRSTSPKRDSKTKKTHLAALVAAAQKWDEILALLIRAGLYIEPLGGIPGAHRIICPWLHQHTDQDRTGTVYFEPSIENAWHGGFKCHHGHCQHRVISDLRAFTNVLKTL